MTRLKDKKYEVLKTRYWLEHRNLKALTEKYIALKNEKDKLDKKVLLLMANKETSRFRGMETPMTDSGISNQSSTG